MVGDRHLTRACLVLAALLGGGASAAVEPAASAVAAEDAGSVATVVSGVLGYTRWPDAPDEGAPLRLCLLGGGAGVVALRHAVDAGTLPRPVVLTPLPGAAPAAAGCDAVYVGAAPPALARELLRRLAGQPVLLVGEGPGFCSDGGMFCLAPDGAGAKFGVNLDAIARSGLRVNPMVLRIARGAPKAAR